MFRGTLTPIYSSATDSYRATVRSDATRVQLTPTVAVGNVWPLATVTSGTASGAIALDEDTNAITVRVTAADSSTKDYTVTVWRVSSGTVWFATMTPAEVNISGCDNESTGSECTQTSIQTSNAFSISTQALAISALGTTSGGSVTGTFSTSNNALKALHFCSEASTVALSGITSSHVFTSSTGAVTPWSLGTPVSVIIGTSCASALSSNNNLSDLTASGAVGVSATFTALTLTPSTFVTSGSASTAIELVVGANAITVRVAVEDTSVTKDYTVTINRRSANVPPSVVTDLEVEAGYNRLSLTWTAPVETVTGYDVHYTTSTTAANDAAAGSNARIHWVDGRHLGKEARDTLYDLHPTAHRVRVRAVNDLGMSDWVVGAARPCPRRSRCLCRRGPTR